MTKDLFKVELVTISITQLEAMIDTKVNLILDAISKMSSKYESDQWFDLKCLIQYLPSHPKPQTVYEWVHKKIIPYHKSPETKMLSFLKSEINEWMKVGRRKTQKERDAMVNKYLVTTNHQS